MNRSGNLQRTYRFGRWHVQPELNLVMCDGRQRKLERKAMEVLICLLERPGEVISVQSILERVWAGRVVEENSVHQRISQIRKALGDDRKNPSYIGHVARRGYHSLAPIEFADEFVADSGPRSEATDVVVADAPQASNEAPLNPWQQALVRLNRWIMIGDDRLSYLVVMVIGLVPILAAPLIGIWDDRMVPGDTLLTQVCPLNESQAMTRGFSGRWNWLIYPAILPLWLFFTRFLFRRSFGFAASSPLVTESRYAPIRQRVQASLSAWQVTFTIIALNVALTVIDQSDVAMRFVDVAQVCPTGVMDWGWYALVYTDVTASNLLLFTVWTTAEQMLFVHFALTTAAFVFLFNLNYMRSIYLRHDSKRQSNSFVLDFDDGDGRFGLRKLATIFDWQLFFCVAGGCVLLIERYFNTRLEVVERLAHQGVCNVYEGLGICSGLAPFNREDVTWLMQDTAQVFVVVSWLVFFMTILWIANVKLLPLRLMGETAGRVAYLREFVPPGSARDIAMKEADPESVEDAAARFRSQHFWPTGDDRAADTLYFCLFIFFLMLFPVLPVDFAQVAVLAVIGLLSWLGTRLFFLIQTHLLARVDRSLVAD